MGRVLFHGPSVNGFYPLPTVPSVKSWITPTITNTFSFTATLDVTPTVWHDCLGHSSSIVLNSVFKLLNLSPNKDGSSANTSSICTHYLDGRMHKLPFLLSQSTTCLALEIVHSVWRPSPEDPISGYRYYVSFIDDVSRYTWIFPVTKKSEVSSIIHRFKPFVENLLSSKLKIF